MRRAWFYLLLIVALAACSSAPRRPASSASWAPSGAYRTAPALPPSLPHFVDHSVGEEEISIQAMSLVGVPHRWGGNTPQSGFDCSGLVRYVVARAAEVELPRTTAEMSSRGVSVEPDEVAPGDLIFFNTTGRAHSHVGIYVGNLRFVSAPSTGGTVRLDYLSNPYWARHFDGIRRVASAHVKPAPFDRPTLLAAPEPRQSPAATAAASTRNDYAAIKEASPEAPSEASPEASPETRAATPIEARPETLPETPFAHAQVAQGVPATPSNARPDAYEPPPPAPVAEAQAQAAQREAQTDSARSQDADTSAQHAPIVEASPAPQPPSDTTAGADDPIARFANGSF
jgi:NlpC/P60 family